MSLVSSSLLLQQDVLFVLFGCFFRWLVGVRSASALRDIASRISSTYLVAFLCNCRQAFSPYDLSVFMRCIHKLVRTQLLHGKKLRFILPDWSYLHMTDRQSIAVHAFPIAYWCHCLTCRINKNNNTYRLNGPN